MNVQVRRLVCALALAVALPLAVLVACGPDFEPEVFVPAGHPADRARFAKGELGILQPGYGINDRVVAYRYLTGGRLGPEEQAAYAPQESLAPQYSSMTPEQWAARAQEETDAQPQNRWLEVRAEFAKSPGASPDAIGQDREIEIQRQGYVDRNDVLNCTDGAFDMAIATLQARAAKWGAASSDLQDWIRGQDQVFSNCTNAGVMPGPAPAPVSASALLKSDRAYQIAAAKFYAMNYDAAIAAFTAIGKDETSPWQPWGEYLAARAEVRKAFFVAPTVNWGEQASFDAALMKDAEARLQRIVASAPNAQIKHAAEAELGFVEVRINPEKRLTVVATALAGPASDANFKQDLADLNFLTSHDVSGNAELLLWLGTNGKTDPLAQWQAKRTLPWLVSALAGAKAGQADAAELMDAAAKVPKGSPAYTTVTYQRARLMLEEGNAAGARELASGLLATSGEHEDASHNAVLALRMKTSRTFGEFLEDAPRAVIGTSWLSESSQAALCGYSGPEHGCLKTIPRVQFDADAAETFNRQLPLSLWITAADDAAGKESLPLYLRQVVAWAGWVRAVGLHDESTVKRLAPMLPIEVRKTAGESDGFPATLALLRNPGFRPYIQQGVQRSLSYSHREMFRDNWWCSPWGDGDKWQDNPESSGPGVQVSVAPAMFLSPEERAEAERERVQLNSLPLGVVWLGQRAIAYVKANPNDKDGAEALALTVRATRYGCFVNKDAAQKAVSKQAFDLLHRLYPKSPWTAKTPYYY